MQDSTNITLIYHSSFHFLFHYPSIIPIYYSSFNSLCIREYLQLPCNSSASPCISLVFSREIDGKENGSYYNILGLYWDNGRENGSYYGILGLHWDREYNPYIIMT